MKDEVPNRPDDISVEAWELAYDTNHALWAVCDDDPDDVKFWQDTKVIARAILQARSQAFDGAVAAVEGLLDEYVANDPERYGVISAIMAIRQHSQKGKSE